MEFYNTPFDFILWYSFIGFGISAILYFSGFYVGQLTRLIRYYLK